ncbi:DUF2536 family protein [Bacillus salitolerans]|uniref:DUF2536 family protein n=1 Tax=Bacillus salitolerans TaxID=1437434 RepID=A0ABW4LRB1_9BACI
MDFKLEFIEDKIEFFEATNLKTLEKQIQEKIDHNRAILLQVHHVSHNTVFHPQTNLPTYTAVVHFKQK